ncbi:MAG: ectoine utilization protein EutA, partial [Pseudomonadota bacterium]
MTQPTLFTGDVALREGAMNKRLGVIALGTDQVIEPTFARIFTGLPIDMFVNRIAYENPLMLENLAAMERDLDRCLGNILPALDLDVVAFGCSSGTVAIGEQTLAER